MLLCLLFNHFLLYRTYLTSPAKGADRAGPFSAPVILHVQTPDQGRTMWLLFPAPVVRGDPRGKPHACCLALASKARTPSATVAMGSSA